MSHIKLDLLLLCTLINGSVVSSPLFWVHRIIPTFVWVHPIIPTSFVVHWHGLYIFMSACQPWRALFVEGLSLVAPNLSGLKRLACA